MGTDGGLTGRGVPWAAIGGLVVGTYRVMIDALHTAGISPQWAIHSPNTPQYPPITRRMS